MAYTPLTLIISILEKVKRTENHSKPKMKNTGGWFEYRYRTKREMKSLIVIILSLLLLDCNPKKKTTNNTNEKVVEVLSHTDYNVIFENDTVEGVPVEILNIGEVNVPSGQVVVCDPLFYPDTPPLLKRVKSGKYPVKIYVAKTEASGDRYAIAKLEFSKGKAKKWVLALREGEDVSELKGKDEFFGMPVDAGLGAFFDYKSGVAYNKFLEDFFRKHPNGNVYNDFFAEEFKKSAKNPNDPNDPGDWANFQLPESDLNVIMFNSGYGDGLYPAYWGIDEKGDTVSLVIDFFVLLVPDA